MQQAAELSVPAPTIEAALDGRFLSGLKDQRVKAAKFFETLGATQPTQQPVRSPICTAATCQGIIAVLLGACLGVACAVTMQRKARHGYAMLESCRVSAAMSCKVPGIQ